MTITPNPRQPLDEQSLALLEREASTWVARGLITQDQASGILAGYEPVPATTIGHWLQGHLIAALAILGVVLVGLGVLLFIGANWQSIGKEIKLGLLFVGLSATYGGGYWAAGPMKMPRVGTALILLGAILYGAAIFLIAQMYHVRAGSPSLLLWWSLGVLPLAYAVRSRAVLVLGIGASLVTLLWYDVLWLRNTDDAPQRVIAFAAVIGATFLALAMVKRRVRHLAWSAPVPATLGLALMLGALYVFTFRGLFDEGLFRPREMSWQFALAFHLSAAVAVVSLAGTLLQESFARRPDRLLVSTVLAAALLMVGGAYLVLF
ncbi:MAG: DUF2157 domain-containing protein, partial [SAR202 cluster bacterium]|nr:DUF2157 domain-containing protein [SAR202 cluster bacterium]